MTQSAPKYARIKSADLPPDPDQIRLREILTIVACLLIALLTAALAGPYFIDWTAQRGLVEAQLGKVLGAPVKTSGGIDLKLLPTPRLELGGVETAQTGGFSLRSAGVRLELAVSPLLRGDLRFIEAAFDAPDIVVPAGVPAVAPGAAGSLPGDAQFERIVIRGGRLRVVDGAGVAMLDLAGLDLDAEAASLSGPFKGSGSFLRGGERAPFRFNTGVVENERLRLKLIVDEAVGLPRADLEGAAFLVSAAGGRRAAFEGAANFSGKALAGWRAGGPLKLDPAGASVDPLEVRLGGEDAPLSMSGTGAIAFGAAPLARFTLVARQFDLDKLLATPKAGAADIMAMLPGGRAAAPLSVPAQVAFSTPAMNLGGETLTDVSLDVRFAPGLPLAAKAGAQGPGRSRLALDGIFETGAAARFEGKLEAGARDLGRLAEWVGQASPDAAAALRATPFRALDVAGDMAVSAAGFSARDMTLKADRSTLRGAAAFTRAFGAERARLFADMTSDALDLDALPDLSEPGALLAGMDYALGLEARAVRVARFGDGMIDSGRIRLKAARAGEIVKLETLSLSDIGGATLEASGDATRDRVHLAGSLDAQRLSDLAALLRRIAPGAWSEALAARAVALSPARMNFGMDAARVAGDGGLRIETLKLDGVARGTKVEASIRPGAAKGALDGLLSIDAPEAPQLIRQFGFESAPVPGVGRGRVTAELKGDFESGFEVSTLAQLAGTQLSYFGRLAGTPQSPEASGQARVKAQDAAPLMRALAVGPPDFSVAMPVEVSARIDVAGGRANMAGLTGSVGGSKLSGDLVSFADTAAGGRTRLTGTLELDRLAMAPLATLVLGPPRAARPGALWSDTRFATGLASAPLVDLSIHAGQFELFEKATGGDARLRLSLAPGVLQVTDLKTRLGGSPLEGKFALRRDGPTAALSGALRIENYRVEQPSFSGILAGAMEFSSTGPNAAALVSGLAGNGRVSLAGLQIPRLDPGAPDRVIAQSDAGQIYVSENDFMGALRRELDKAPLQPGDRAFEATLAGGVLRLPESGGVSGAFDLRTLGFELRASVAPTRLPKDWSGPAPPVALVLKGPVAAPAREIDAGGFVNALSARAIAREQARVEALEADIRERAHFARRQRGLAFLRLREREIAAFEAEQARLAAEEERKRLEEDRRKAEEDRRRAVEEERRQAMENLRLERERVEFERRELEARRREAEAAARQNAPPPQPGPRTPLSLPVFPGAGTDPSTLGRY